MEKRLNIGNLRQPLVQTTTAASGTALGTYAVQRYSSVGGMIQCVGSLTVQARFGTSSGNYQVSSSFAANSGGSSFSMTNPGLFASFNLLAASSQQATVLICGLP